VLGRQWQLSSLGHRRLDIQERRERLYGRGGAVGPAGEDPNTYALLFERWERRRSIVTEVRFRLLVGLRERDPELDADPVRYAPNERCLFQRSSS
jgi:hypothetical protein